jgi:hypothetical protein
MKNFLILFYVAMIVVFSIYGANWGDYAYKGFFYNLGMALVWPAIIFPSIGKAIGTIVILGLVGYFTFFKN